MKLSECHGEGLVDEGLIYYFKVASYTFEEIKQDLLNQKPIASIVSFLTNKLDTIEKEEKAVILKALLKEYYQLQIRQDEKQEKEDNLEIKVDADRKVEIPNEQERNRDDLRQKNELLQTHEKTLAAFQQARARLSPRLVDARSELQTLESNLIFYNREISTKCEKIKHLEAERRCLPAEVIVTHRPAPEQQVVSPRVYTAPRAQSAVVTNPSPYTTSTSLGTQAAVIHSTPGMIPVYGPNPRIPAIASEISRLESEIQGLTEQQSDASSALSAGRSILDKVEEEDTTLRQHIQQEEYKISGFRGSIQRLQTLRSSLKKELEETLPQRERLRAQNKIAREDREQARNVREADTYEEEKILKTLDQTNQAAFKKARTDRYWSLARNKSALIKTINETLYQTFFNGLESSLTSLKMLETEKETLGLIKKNLIKHHEMVVIATSQKTELDSIRRRLREQKKILEGQEKHLATLIQKNPKSQRLIEDKESDNRIRDPRLLAYRENQKTWGRASMLLGLVSAMSLIPLLVYAAGAVLLSTLVIVGLSVVTGGAGLGALLGLKKWSMNKKSASLEEGAIGENTRQISSLKDTLCTDSQTIKQLTDTDIPNMKLTVKGLEADETEKEGEWERSKEQARQFLESAKQLTPSAMDKFGLGTVIASAPPTSPPPYVENADTDPTNARACLYSGFK